MTIRVGGVRVTPITVDALHRHIAVCIRKGRREAVLNANAHAINLAQSDSEFRAILNGATVVFCDGFGIQLAARLLGHPPPPRITYAAWFDLLASFCAGQGFSIFLLGARPGVAEEAARRLRKVHPALHIVGTHHGHYDHCGPDNDRVLSLINEACPDILLVGFGMPLQEKWIAANLARAHARIFLSGGACIDYAAGTVRRGSPWLVDHGLEWLARLLIEPRRLWRRYLLGNPRFLLTVLCQRWREGLAAQ